MLEEVARNGHVVAAVEHPFNTNVVDFPSVPYLESMLLWVGTSSAAPRAPLFRLCANSIRIERYSKSEL